MSQYQPRYELYLQTTDNPKNYEYMEFIAKMKRLYLDENNIQGDSIINHDEFTEYIRGILNE